MNTAPKTQEALRLEKAAALRKMGIDPYPAANFFTNTTTAQVAATYPKDPTSCQKVRLAGRLMSRRIMGAVAFGELQDHTGQIQLYYKRDNLCPGEDKQLYNQVFKKLLDIGDIIGIEGNAFITKVGDLAINVTSLTLLSKALKPLPVVKEVKKGDQESKRYYTFSNPEHRYRQRYLDLILNPDVKNIFQCRAQIMQIMRNEFNSKGYLEVETPVLQPIYGGAAARPFTTHHNTLDMPLFLRISNELYLKRLIVGGFPGVYEFAKDFRNEGMSRFHNPEFTMLELYVAYRDYHWMMEATEQLLHTIATTLHGTPQVKVGTHTIDFSPPFQRFTMFEAIAHFTGIDISKMDVAALRNVAEQFNIPLDDSARKGKIIDEIFGSQCEPHLIQPTFITDYPIEMSPLAKAHRHNPALVERFELICNGKELCNAFSELNDPIVQRERFKAQQKLAKLGDKEAMVLDEDYLLALSYAMPPTAGIGYGIGRLTMMMTNAASIQEVIFFPQMRPAKPTTEENPNT